MELKRDYSAHSTYSSASESDRKPSLFDEYQFFTPGLYSPLVNCHSRLFQADSLAGIFMGLMASFLCLIILYIAISAVSSLQVPYAAFEKDTSTAVQKKQQ